MSCGLLQPPAAARRGWLGLADQGQVGVLQRGAADLKLADVVSARGEELADEDGGVGSAAAVMLPARVQRTSSSPAIWSLSSAGVPCAAIRPAARMMIRLGELPASSRSWVVIKTVVPSLRQMPARRSWNSRRACGSKPAVGSIKEQQFRVPGHGDDQVQAPPLATDSRRMGVRAWPARPAAASSSLVAQDPRSCTARHRDGSRRPGSPGTPRTRTRPPRDPARTAARCRSGPASSSRR